jgi:hypothetical protein
VGGAFFNLTFNRQKINKIGEDITMKFKQVLTMALATAMLLANTNMAFGATFKDVENNYEEAVDVLSSLNIIHGYEDGTFRPEKTITRAELAKILVETLGYGNIVNGINNKFPDTEGHWASGYATVANAVGLVAGYPDGTFKPDATVTYDEAFTMILRALGYSDDVVKGTWPMNYKIKAYELKITDGIDINSVGADRGGIAQAIFNALDDYLVKVDLNKNISYKYKQDGKTRETLIDKIAKHDSDYFVSLDTLDPNSKSYGGDYVDLSQYLYQSINVYKNKDDEVIYVNDSNSIVIEGVVADEKQEEGILKIKTSNKKPIEIEFEDEIKVVYNGAEYYLTVEELYELNDGVNEFEKMIIIGESKDKNSKIDNEEEVVAIIITQQTESVVVKSAYKKGRTKFDIFTLPQDKKGNVDLSKVTVKGDVEALEDIKRGDVVTVYEALDGKIITFVVTRDNIVEGKVTRMSPNDDELYINGKKYLVNKGSSEVYNVSTESIRLSLGDEGAFYLDKDNKLVGMDVDTIVRENYGIIIATAPGTIKKGAFDFEVDEYPAIKIATKDNRTEVFDIFVELNEDDGTVSKSAKYDTTFNKKEFDLLVSGENEIKFVDSTSADLAKGQIVKYNVNKYGQIDEITLVREDIISERTSSKSFELAQNALIFKNDGDKYPLVKEKHLANTIEGIGVYNRDGEIEVLLVDAEDVNRISDETLIAYLANTDDIAMGYDDEDRVVQIPTLFINGKRVEYYTESKNTFSGENEAVDRGVYQVEIEDDVITQVIKLSPVNALVDSISYKLDRINLTMGEQTQWYFVSEEATIVSYDKTSKKVAIADLFDIDEDMELNVVIVDDVIEFIEIVK